jgi:hypothetical protein
MMAEIARPNNIQFESQSIVGKRIIYHDDRSMSEMLSPRFWSNVAKNQSQDRLRVGDRVMLMQVQYEDKSRVILKSIVDVADVLVTKVDARGAHFMLLLDANVANKTESGGYDDGPVVKGKKVA